MTIETHTPTVAEIRFYEAQAHALRAQAMRDGFKAVPGFVASLIQRVAAVFARPVHA